MTRAWLVLAVVGCRDAVPPAGAPPPPPPRDAARDAPVVADAAIAACADAPRSHRFAFGTLAVPVDGWCWRRTAEGDDQSGVVLDNAGRIRARYYELSFGEKVGDACDPKRPGVHAITSGRVRGVAYRTCALDGGRHCFSFDGRANLCTEPPEDAPISALDWIDSLVP